MSCDYIFTLSTGIWVDIDSPSDISVSSISGKLLSSGSLGKLDILINGCHYIESGCIQPPLTSEEQSIYSELYKVDFFKKKSIEVLGAVGATLWTEIREADSVVKRSNPGEISKLYISQQKNAQNEVDKLVNLYHINKSTPRSVDYYGIE